VLARGECYASSPPPRAPSLRFPRLPRATRYETVVFSWIEYPDKATRDAAAEKMSADPEAMQTEMPFDSSRMFWGCFQPVVDE
jgi:uncharacterized protein YbaA (DUF1428 family)